MGIKAVKNNNKSANGAGGNAGIQETITLVTDAAHFEAVPHLKQAAKTTLTILETVQSVKAHKENFQRLANDIADLIAKIWKSYQETPADEKPDWPPHELRRLIGEHSLTLESILEFVEEKVRRSRGARIFQSSSDINKIQEYRGHLEDATSQFDVFTKRSRLNVTCVPKEAVDQIEATNRFESVNAVKEREQKETAHKAERLRLAEEDNGIIEEEMGKGQVAEGQAKELQPLLEAETARIVDAHRKELQRDLEKARLAEEERRKLERLREQDRQAEKQEKDRQEFVKARIAAEEAMERLRLMEESILIAEEKAKERKRVQKEEVDRSIAAEEKAREEAEARRRKERVVQEEELHRMWEERKAHFEKQGEEEAGHSRLREAEAARIAEMEKKKRAAIVTPRRKPDKSSRRKKSPVEDGDDDRTLVGEYDSEAGDESGEELYDKPAQRKKTTGNSPPAVGSAFADMGHNTPTQWPPQMFQPSPHHADFSPYVPSYSASPPPPMTAMYPGYYGQTYGTPPPVPGSFHNSGTISGGISGGIHISNTTNGTATQIPRPPPVASRRNARRPRPQKAT